MEETQPKTAIEIALEAVKAEIKEIKSKIEHIEYILKQAKIE